MTKRRAADFDAGRRVGKYELVTRLSVGGMAELYLAVLPGPGGFKKLVALKMILPDVRRDESFVAMFLDEARLTAGLSHPHLGQVYELGHEPETGELYLAMEYVAGQTLRAVMRRAQRSAQPLPVEFSCRVIRDACLGLHSAHTFVDPGGKPRAIVHRDVSPANVMVSYGGTVKVIDFGIARAPGRRVRTQVGTVKGTVGYMSPEQAMDEPLDARSDVFSAGMVLYELLAGEAPLAELRSGKLLEALAVNDVPDLAQVAPHLPPGLAEVVMSALTRDVAARCPSARELARRLEAACPRMMDEEDLAGVMRDLFPDTIELSRQLLESAVAPEPVGPVIAQTAAALQGATNPATPLLPEEEAAPAEPPPAPRTASLLVAAGVVIAAMLGGGYLYLEQGPDDGPVEDPAMAAREAEVMPQLHMALASHDPTKARQLLESCNVRGKPCPQAQAMLPKVVAEEEKRAQAQARAVEAQANEPATAPAARGVRPRRGEGAHSRAGVRGGHRAAARVHDRHGAGPARREALVRAGELVDDARLVAAGEAGGGRGPAAGGEGVPEPGPLARRVEGAEGGARAAHSPGGRRPRRGGPRRQGADGEARAGAAPAAHRRGAPARGAGHGGPVPARRGSAPRGRRRRGGGVGDARVHGGLPPVGRVRAEAGHRRGARREAGPRVPRVQALPRAGEAGRRARAEGAPAGEGLRGALRGRRGRVEAGQHVLEVAVHLDPW